MKFINFKKKLILGTAQFGKPYGFNNLGKKIPNTTIENIIKLAHENSIKHIDTATSYNFNNSLLKQRRWKVDTKIIVTKNNTKNNNAIKKLNTFMNKKNIELDTVYFHNPECLFYDYGKKIYKHLELLKKKNFIQKIGISVYEPEIIKKILNIYKIDVVQIPYNIFDRRFEKIQFFLSKKKIKIYARSIFLQGALLSKKNTLLTKKYEFQKLDNFSHKHKIDKMSLCLNFVNFNKFIDKIIIGVDNQDQLESILHTKKIKKLNFSLLVTNNKKIIDPRKWKKFKKMN